MKLTNSLLALKPKAEDEINHALKNFQDLVNYKKTLMVDCLNAAQVQAAALAKQLNDDLNKCF